SFFFLCNDHASTQIYTLSLHDALPIVDAGLMEMTDSEIEALIINLWIVLTNWTNFLYMSGHITDSNKLEEKWVWQALRQMVFLEGAYLRGESRQTYEGLLSSLGPSDLFASLSSGKNIEAESAIQNIPETR